MATARLRTALTDLLQIEHPVMLAGMGSVSSHELVAAVSNAGGFGTFGGATFTPSALRQEIKFCKEALGPGKRFGVDLLLPQVGGNARKTNYDYTHGHLDELFDIMIEEKIALFVCAVGVPPKWAVDKLHAAGIPVMNMVGAPHHVHKALEQGVDMICAQGSEAGGHTGVVMTMPLVPQCVDICRGRKNFFGTEIPVIAAGGLFDGRGLAASLALGAAGVWIGTRFIATPESATSPVHRNNVVKAQSVDCMQTIVYTGRPCRVMKNPYAERWEKDSAKLLEKTAKGITPFAEELEGGTAQLHQFMNNLMGQAVGGVTEIKPAGEVVKELVSQALEVMQGNQRFVARL